MKSKFKDNKKAQALAVQLDTGKCMACWKCLEVCTNNVLGRINLPWHKHIRIIKEANCIGCLKCVKVCAHNALSRVLVNDTKRG